MILIKGLYVDIVSGEALFTSTWTNSTPGCGWPSFQASIKTTLRNKDTSHNS